MKLPTTYSDIPNITFYGDSSSRDKDYMVAGGFAIAGNRLVEVEDHIATLRDDFGIRSEFHWADYRGGRRKQAYEALIEYGFDLVAKRKAALHVIISPFKRFDHKREKGQNKDTSINKMYYQLCLHRLCRFYGKSRAIHIRLDAGNDSDDICLMRNPLSAAAYSKYNTLPNCVRSIEPVNSELVGGVQLADVMVGAIAAHMNHDGYLSHSPKKKLADFVLQTSGRSSWKTNTPKASKFMTIWHFKV